MQRSLFHLIREDWTANEKNWKTRLILILFRIAHACARGSSLVRMMTLPILVGYRVFVEWLLCVELPAKTQVGGGLRIYHGHALVVNDHTIIGRNCILRHCTTIGCALLPDDTQGPSPVIGDNVELGSNVCIIGGIHIGDGAQLGAGTVVVKDVPAGAVVVGNPARIIRRREPSGLH